MKVNKIKTHELEKCYSICPLTYNGTEHMLVAAEKVNKCLCRRKYWRADR